MLAADSGSLGNAIDSAAVFGMMWWNECTGSVADAVRCVCGISWTSLACLCDLLSACMCLG